MNNSMWIDAVETNPMKDNNVPHTSVQVLFWAERSIRPYWGHFDFNLNGWITTDQRGHATFIESGVKYFAYIDNPYK